MPCHPNLCFQNIETCLKSHQPSLPCWSTKSKFSCTLNRFVPPVPTSLCKQAHILVYASQQHYCCQLSSPIPRPAVQQEVLLHTTHGLLSVTGRFPSPSTAESGNTAARSLHKSVRRALAANRALCDSPFHACGADSLPNRPPFPLHGPTPSLSPVAQLSAAAPLPARTRGRSKASPQPLCSGPNKPKNSGSPQRPGAVPAVCPRTALTHSEAASSGAVAKSPSTSTSGSSAAMIAGSHLSREEAESRGSAHAQLAASARATGRGEAAP